ncbi:hypothetical protein BJ508DRAFT_156294 [Ascobolus immersus RN42]|uniref:F-box domain-containing protein n=1 Tax=Ascobolus immersus RN42 TaxID=1160509 RepID=A0A3N4HWV2_ASCIM|nr:hypothetical protein BJ508DRAFT_156294 [Ascobolus immersus RN42]
MIFRRGSFFHQQHLLRTMRPRRAAFLAAREKLTKRPRLEAPTSVIPQQQTPPVVLPSPKRKFHELPTELRLMIYHHLDAFYLLCLSHVHSVFYYDINSSLCYKLVKAASGYTPWTSSRPRNLTVKNIHRLSTDMDAKRYNRRFVMSDSWCFLIGTHVACPSCRLVCRAGHRAEEYPCYWWNIALGCGCAASLKYRWPCRNLFGHSIRPFVDVSWEVGAPWKKDI